MIVRGLIREYVRSHVQSIVRSFVLCLVVVVEKSISEQTAHLKHRCGASIGTCSGPVGKPILRKSTASVT